MVRFRLRHVENCLDCKLENQLLLHEMREGSRSCQVIPASQARSLPPSRAPRSVGKLRAFFRPRFPPAPKKRKNTNNVPFPDRQPSQMRDLPAFQNGIPNVHHDRGQGVYRIQDLVRHLLAGTRVQRRRLPPERPVSSAQSLLVQIQTVDRAPVENDHTGAGDEDDSFRQTRFG